MLCLFFYFSRKENLFEYWTLNFELFLHVVLKFEIMVKSLDYEPISILSGVMVIVVGHGYGDTSSNPGRG